MENFNYYNPTHIFFGKGEIAVLKKQIPAGTKVMITYGGGSIKKNGIYEQVKTALQECQIIEFSGIEPNPHYETLMKAVDVIRRENIGFVLAVGGGSVIDGTKFIVAAACYDGEDKWEDLMVKRVAIKKALPFGSVLTLPATGSEMNSGAVITRVGTQEKLDFHSPLLFPKFSVLDPEATYSLPKKQIANGIIDTYVHVMEQYLGYPGNAMIQDRFSEGILKTLLEIGSRIYKAGQPDYDDMANFMWSATMGLNGLIAVGVGEDWATHRIGHELTAFHGLDHAVTLAIVLPGVLTAVKELRKVKLLQYAERVWGIDPSEPKAGEEAIMRTEEFFQSLGVKTRLSDYGIGKETIERIVERFKQRGTQNISFLEDVNSDNLEQILVSRL